MAIRCSSANDSAIGIDALTENLLRPAWRVASELVTLLGGYGSGHLVVEMAGQAELGPSRNDWIPQQIGASKLMQRSLSSLEPNETVIEGLQRELMRSIGYPVWEPEPDDEGKGST